MVSVTQSFNRHRKVSLSSSAQELAKGRRHKHLSSHRNRKVPTLFCCAVLPYLALKVREENSHIFIWEHLPISYHFWAEMQGRLTEHQEQDWPQPVCFHRRHQGLAESSGYKPKLCCNKMNHNTCTATSWCLTRLSFQVSLGRRDFLRHFSWEPECSLYCKACVQERWLTRVGVSSGPSLLFP